MWMSEPTPVTTISMTAVRRSTVKSQPTRRPPATIQSKSCSVIGTSPSDNTALSAQTKESSTLPIAIALIAAFEKRRPKIPLIRKPANGRAGMSQSCCIPRFCDAASRADCIESGAERRSVFHAVHFVDVERRSVLENGQDDGQPHCRLRGGHHH